MTKTYKFQFDKLIRDKIPELLEQKNIKSELVSLSDEEYVRALKEKLVEESIEVSEAKCVEDICEELGDIMEVVYSIYQAVGISYEEVDRVRIQKNSSKGGFEKQLFCKYIEIEEHNEYLDHYLKNPEKYKKIG